MHRQRVTSSVIATLGYDPTWKALEVEFQTGRVYEYAKVPLATYQALVSAHSIGGYFNRFIRNRYRARETTPEGLPLRREWGGPLGPEWVAGAVPRKAGDHQQRIRERLLHVAPRSAVIVVGDGEEVDDAGTNLRNVPGLSINGLTPSTPHDPTRRSRDELLLSRAGPFEDGAPLLVQCNPAELGVSPCCGSLKLGRVRYDDISEWTWTRPREGQGADWGIASITLQTRPSVGQ